MTSFKETVSEVLKGVKYMVDSAMSKTTKIYNGTVVAREAIDGKWKIRFNGEEHLLSSYGNIVPTYGLVVKVFIPQNNMSLAFFI